MNKKNISILLLILFLLNLFPTVNYANADYSAEISLFQNYINNTLPSQYLGNSLSLSGIVDDATKAAAIKLVKYELNQYGASLTVNSNFNLSEQNVFDNTMGNTVKKGNTSDWAIIIRGLLYCNEYDPGAFNLYSIDDTCVLAINQFKFDNGINSTGDYDHYYEGIINGYTMSFLLWRYNDRTVEDGMYYIKNTYSNKYMTAYNGLYADYTDICQNSQQTGSYNQRQLWKITYVGNGYYSIRSMLDLNKLVTYALSNVCLLDNGSILDNLFTIASTCCWIITTNQDGTVNIKMSNANGRNVLSINENYIGEGDDIIIERNPDLPRSHWVLEKRTATSPDVLLMYEGSFVDSFGIVSDDTANEFFQYAQYPFYNFLNTTFDVTSQLYPSPLPANDCEYGYFYSLTPPTPNPGFHCCNPSQSCTHNWNTNILSERAWCQCSYHLIDILNNYPEPSGIDLKMMMFSFRGCYYGLSQVGGNNLVQRMEPNMLSSTPSMLYCIRGLQHETTHSYGCHDSGNACSSRCIMNGGFVNIAEFDLSCIWCNKCLNSFDINKF